MTTALEIREAGAPPEARGPSRDAVRLMLTDGQEITHHAFTDLPDLLCQGDLLVVNNSATLPAAVRLDLLAVHFSTELADGSWLIELRRRASGATRPYEGGVPGEWLPLPGGATLRLVERHTKRLWRARLDTPALPYLSQYGRPIRYAYVDRDWPLSAYQTVFALEPGSAEMPSAGRPFTASLVTRLVSKGIAIAPITLHTGVASPEKDEAPYAERYTVPESTARLIQATAGRIIAVGTTVVRALETTGGRARSGWTEHVVTPEVGVHVVDGMLTGFHEPRSSHLQMLTAMMGPTALTESYAAAVRHEYLWHEFGDVHLILRPPRGAVRVGAPR